MKVFSALFACRLPNGFQGGDNIPSVVRSPASPFLPCGIVHLYPLEGSGYRLRVCARDEADMSDYLASFLLISFCLEPCPKVLTEYVFLCFHGHLTTVTEFLSTREGLGNLFYYLQRNLPQ